MTNQCKVVLIGRSEICCLVYEGGVLEGLQNVSSRTRTRVGVDACCRVQSPGILELGMGEKRNKDG